MWSARELPADLLARAQDRHVLLEAATQRLLEESIGGLMERLAVQGECAPVHRDQIVGAYVLERLYGLFRTDVVGMVCAPPGVASDRQEGDLERAELCPDLLEAAKVSGVAGEEQSVCAARGDPRRAQAQGLVCYATPRCVS